MKVNKELVEKLADLSKLEFSPEEQAHVIDDLSNMLNFIDKLNELDVEGVEPLVYVNEDTNSLREDIIKMEITKEEALKNAPLADSDYFKVPKVLKK
jgi:aspartyl-tRNA(Asn)/glutamyl-tRNA(Gln) amidotransferase subunit C